MGTHLNCRIHGDDPAGSAPPPKKKKRSMNLGVASSKSTLWSNFDSPKWRVAYKKPWRSPSRIYLNSQIVGSRTGRTWLVKVGGFSPTHLHLKNINSILIRQNWIYFPKGWNKQIFDLPPPIAGIYIYIQTFSSNGSCGVWRIGTGPREAVEDQVILERWSDIFIIKTPPFSKSDV